MDIKQIEKLQKEYGMDGTQSLITSGQVWSFEGSSPHRAMDLLELGVCLLPDKRHKDYYGNTVPSREDLESGTKGTLQNCIDFWSDEDRVLEFFGLQEV